MDYYFIVSVAASSLTFVLLILTLVFVAAAERVHEPDSESIAEHQRDLLMLTMLLMATLGMIFNAVLAAQIPEAVRIVQSVARGMLLGGALVLVIDSYRAWRRSRR